MAMILRGATLVELEPASVEVADLRVEGGVITGRGERLDEAEGDEVIDLAGRTVLPGLVSAHHHLHAALLRGAQRTVGDEAAEQHAVDQLEDALSGDDLEVSARAGALEALSCGTTTLFNVHASPDSFDGALDRVAGGVDAVGLRALLACEVSGRAGKGVAERALEETRRFVQAASGRLRGAVGLGHLDTVDDALLESVAALRAELGALLLGNIAELRAEEKRCKDRFGATPGERIIERQLVGEDAVYAQGVHLPWPELSALIAQGTWLVHAPRSNMSSATGRAAAAKFGVHACLGTDVMVPDVLAEAQAAWLRARDAGQPIDVLRFLANGHRLASRAFGVELGPLREGAAADLVVFDYRPPTPLTAETLGAHFATGLSSRLVESVMVDGLWRLWKRGPLSVSADEVAEESREAARAVWSRVAA